MFYSMGRSATALALCVSVGFHWFALQSIAWTAMLVANVQHVPLSAAVAKTFDGAHPCSLCHMINRGKTTEKKSDITLPTLKIDMMCASRDARLVCPFVRVEYPAVGCLSFSSGNSPPVPPPRLLVS